MLHCLQKIRACCWFSRSGLPEAPVNSSGSLLYHGVPHSSLWFDLGHEDSRSEPKPTLLWSKARFLRRHPRGLLCSWSFIYTSPHSSWAGKESCFKSRAAYQNLKRFTGKRKNLFHCTSELLACMWQKITKKLWGSMEVLNPMENKWSSSPELVIMSVWLLIWLTVILPEAAG